MKTVRDARFYQERAILPAYAGAEIINASFEGCHVTAQASAGQWTRLSEFALTDCAQMNCSLDTCAIEDVSIHNLKRTGGDPLFLWGCVFRHVTLSGRISGIKINQRVGLGSKTPIDQETWNSAIAAYYEDVDWALDIAGAAFAGGIDLDAVPGRKIRRNPETQLLVTRERLASTDWQSLDYQNTAIDITLGFFHRDSLFDSVVVPARTASKYAKADLAVLARLREAGLAEPD